MWSLNWTVIMKYFFGLTSCLCQGAVAGCKPRLPGQPLAWLSGRAGLNCGWHRDYIGQDSWVLCKPPSDVHFIWTIEHNVFRRQHVSRVDRNDFDEEILGWVNFSCVRPLSCWVSNSLAQITELALNNTDLVHPDRIS